jgi:hypothetical protein
MNIDLQFQNLLITPVIVALVQVARHFGLSTEYARWLNAFLCVASYFGIQQATGNPMFANYFVMGLTMLAMFLTAAGFYDVVEVPLKKVIPAKVADPASQ